MIPDDATGRPLTPREQAAIVDLERRFLLEAPTPVRDRLVGVRSARLGRRRAVQNAGPLLALLGVACLLVAVLVVNGGGVLGAAAVFVSVAGTATLWPLLPAGLGGPSRPVWRRSRRPRRPVRGHR